MKVLQYDGGHVNENERAGKGDVPFGKNYGTVGKCPLIIMYYVRVHQKRVLEATGTCSDWVPCLNDLSGET